MIYLLIANLARRMLEWAERRRDRHERHIVDLYLEAWVTTHPRRGPYRARLHARRTRPDFYAENE